MDGEGITPFWEGGGSGRDDSVTQAGALWGSARPARGSGTRQNPLDKVLLALPADVTGGTVVTHRSEGSRLVDYVQQKPGFQSSWHRTSLGLMGRYLQ